MPKGILILAILFFSFLDSRAQVSNELPTAYARSIASQLCSPEFHGRGYVAHGDSIAAEFLAAEFAAIGVKPLKKTYFQPFSFPVNSFPGQMTVISGNDSLIPGIDFLVDPACPSVQSVWRFRTLSVEEAFSEELLYSAVEQVVSGGKFNAFLIDLRNASSDTLKRLKAMEGLVSTFGHTVVWTNEKFTWSVAQEQSRYPILYISGGVSLKKEITVRIESRFYAKYTSRNVIGYLPASKRTKRTILLSAHYDHLGRMGSQTYFPGANDNASGTATLLSVAKQLAGQKRNCNYVFIAFAGEEAGLVGSQYFTEHPLIKLKKIHFLLNLDIMGSGEEGITVVNATKHPDEFALLQKINTEEKLLTQVKQRGPAANSDHYWFSEKGVPAFFIYTMGPNKNYHDIFDTYENLSFAETEDLVRLITAFLSELK